ncbi:hypothetical protein [Sporolactobacillus terrae]|jgi:hypothetical protein|uniref:Uncharacterized protein n=1 Tax=Sporolactobacillus terrae TaxID=269673 RepID=A0A5K7X0H5_9BACL|nr:hypothetical protein [Sporolactobacillus terrae]BBN99479.1 hypothetical protein St703_21840 [Sporolactobacillus terrae]
MYTLLYTSYFGLLFIFLLFVGFRISMGGMILIYLLICFPCIMPFVVLLLDQPYDERKKAEKMERDAN